MREIDPKKVEANRKYERERKRKQRENLKKRKQENNPEEVKRLSRNKQSLTAIRAKRRCNAEMAASEERRIDQGSSRKRKAALSEENERENIPLKISKSLFNSMTPRSKRKTKLRLKDSFSPGEKKNFRRFLGINLSNEIQLGKEDRSGMAEKVKKFFDREDVSQVCPDTRKFKKDPITGEKVPLRYRMHYLTLLYEKL